MTLSLTFARNAATLRGKLMIVFDDFIDKFVVTSFCISILFTRNIKVLSASLMTKRDIKNASQEYPFHQHNWYRYYFSLFMLPHSYHAHTHRNRLESNSEHWNALLLSLREMTEWVIRKDTELLSLSHSPVRGDAASLAKQLVSMKNIVDMQMALSVRLWARQIISFSHALFLMPLSLTPAMIDVLPISTITFI
jgi:hypothetical protein